MANDQTSKLVTDMDTDSANINDEHERDDTINAPVGEQSRQRRKRGYVRKPCVVNIDGNKTTIKSASSLSSANRPIQKKTKKEEIPGALESGNPQRTETTTSDRPRQTLEVNNAAGDVSTQSTISQGVQPCYMAEEIQGWAQFLIDNLR